STRGFHFFSAPGRRGCGRGRHARRGPPRRARRRRWGLRWGGWDRGWLPWQVVSVVKTARERPSWHTRGILAARLAPAVPTPIARRDRGFEHAALIFRSAMEVLRCELST